MCKELAATLITTRAFDDNSGELDVYVSDKSFIRWFIELGKSDDRVAEMMRQWSSQQEHTDTTSGSIYYPYQIRINTDRIAK